MRIEEILIIRNGDTRYGIPTQDIEQILRVPEITPLALSPKVVQGLCAVGGNIITAMDINLLLGLKAVDKAHMQSRLLTLGGRHENLGLLVAAVDDTVDVDGEKLERIAEPEDAVVAIYKHRKGIVQILDLPRLFKDVGLRQFDSKEVKEGAVRTVDDSVAKKADYERFLLFRMAKERYAVRIENLREIIGMYYDMTEIANSRPEIRGMMSLRDELLVVADLRSYYGFKAEDNDKNRILVMRGEGDKILGLIIDEIIDIREYQSDEIDVIPENFRNSKVSGVIHDKERLVSLIGGDVLGTIFRTHEKIIVTSRRDESLEASDAVMEVVVFKLGDEEYAIDIEGVAEIIDATAVTPVYDAPEYIDGVINIRGQVVTIGSLHKRLGIPVPESDDQKIIVCQAGKNRIGFFVNSVSDVTTVSRDELYDENGRGELFSNVLHFDGGKRLVLLFDLSALIDVKAVA